jgi:hypothetical protein
MAEPKKLDIKVPPVAIHYKGQITVKSLTPGVVVIREK